MLASMCKLKAGRLGRQLNDQCLQFWGGMGFTNDVAISRSYRWEGRGGVCCGPLSPPCSFYCLKGCCDMENIYF